MNRVIMITAMVLMAPIVVGCGGDTYVKVQGTTTVSKGQELTVVQRALNEGAITKSEYDRLYGKILSRPN